MLQIKNTLGGGKPEGLYVWKKYGYIPEQTIVNPTFHIKANVSTQKATITSDDINFKAFGTLTDNNNFYQSREPEFCNFMNGFMNSNSSVNFAISTSTYSGQLELNYSNNSYWNAFTNMTPTGTGAELTASNLFKTTIDDTLQYTGTKTIAAMIEEFISYVVSDKETAYPDGGEKGGYYYEKISNLKFTFGTFTPTSNQKETTIVHGLNDKIRFFGIYTEHIKPTESSLYQVEALSLHRGITYASNGTSTENYNGRVSTTYVLTSGPYWYDQGFKISSLYGIGDVTESSITIFKDNRATNDTSSGSTEAPYFIGGRVHKWIAIADWEV